MSLDFSILEWILLGALALFFILQVYWYSRYLAAPVRRIRKDKKCALSNDKLQQDEFPGVSVIISAHNESYNLSQYLQALLTQDYPTFEVIVVDDGSEDNTREVVEYYLTQDPRLHMTFVPFGARVGSTKKLALTLGAKAAQYEWLLLTDADCRPESNHWIRTMMAQATKDIVLGFSPYFYDKGFVNRLVRFDTLFNGLHYLGAALCGHPYMGVGRNLAYRKSLFFESGGFTHLMTNRAGDDDLFVNHVATKTNTTVALNRESYMWSLAKTSLREWLLQKRRHLSVSPAYRTITKSRLLFEPLTRGLFYATVILILVFGRWDEWRDITAMIPVMAAIGLFLVRWILQTAVLNTSARRMGLHRFTMWSVLGFDILLPLVNAWMLVVPKRKTNKW
ncbi:MAG: glycosyltransferase [Paludibacteraceae bacterium]|nr:glycosyltransferase [Paludibacteraceae bacterium]